MSQTTPSPEEDEEEVCDCCGGSGVDIMADGSSRPCHCKFRDPAPLAPERREP